ncbi:MAG TPA: hypothetical protein VE988_12825 [Gemmataceae bacterium]|nr:hypothetical protein [Gemmataceae bacterium]
MNWVTFFSLTYTMLISMPCDPEQVPVEHQAGAQEKLVLPSASIRVRGKSFAEYNKSSDIPLALDGPRCRKDEAAGPVPDSYYLGIIAGDQKKSWDLLLLVEQLPDGTFRVTATHKGADTKMAFNFDLVGPKGEVLVKDFEPGPNQQYTFPKASELKKAK